MRDENLFDNRRRARLPEAMPTLTLSPMLSAILDTVSARRFSVMRRSDIKS